MMSLLVALHNGPRPSRWSGRWLRLDAPSTRRLKSWLKTNACARSTFAAASRKRLPEPCCLSQSSSKRIPNWAYAKLFCRYAPVWHDLDDTGYSTLILLPNKDHDSIEAALPEQAAPVP